MERRVGGGPGGVPAARSLVRRLRLALLAVLVLAGCAGKDTAVEPLPPPPSTRPLPSTTAPPDYSGVVLPVAGGRTTTTTVAMGPGKATVKGTITAPDGTPIQGVMVRVQRLAGAGVATMDTSSGADGTWSAQNVLGGAYRVRAWRAPDLAVTTPAFFFVGATETFDVVLKVEKNFGTTPQPAVAPNPPVVGETTNLVLQLSSRSVDAEGVVQGAPMVGATVELAGGASWGVGLPNPTVTDGTGRARWELICRGAGVQPLRLTVNGTESYQLALPACAEPPPPPASSTSSVPGASSSTTKPAGTTTTTKPAPTTTTTRRGRP